jgi:tripartite-type tricarboxylate transporter receptor subunit TctC
VRSKIDWSKRRSALAAAIGGAAAAAAAGAASAASATAAAVAAVAAAPFRSAVAQSDAADLKGPLRIVVGYPPGGSSDRGARLLAEVLQQRHGLSVVVENKPGAGGRLAAQQFRQTRPNELALLVGNPAVMSVAPLVFKDVGYDVAADFVPVSYLANYDFVVAVGPTMPTRNMTELVAWFRANPTQATIGVPATGSLPHFFALMLGERAGLQAEVVGYKGSGPLLTDLAGAQIPVAIDTLDAAVQLHQGGKLRLLAVSSATRSRMAPDVPTLKEAGIDLEAVGWNVLFASSKMPRATVSRLAAMIEQAMADPALRSRFDSVGMDPISASQARTAQMLEAFRAQWEPVVRRSGYQQ